METTFRPAYLPRPCDIVLTPRLIARLLLMGAGGLPFPSNPPISNSARLEVHLSDISICRGRTMRAGTARASQYERPDNNSPMWQILEHHPSRLAPPPEWVAQPRGIGAQRRSRFPPVPTLMTYRSLRPLSEDNVIRLPQHFSYASSSDGLMGI